MHDVNDDMQHSLSLRALQTPDICRDNVLSKFTHLVSKTLGVPASFISVMDDNNQYIKAAHNFFVATTVRADSLCKYVVEGDVEIIIPDTRCDPCFATNPFVIGEPFVRFYAGVPLKTAKVQYLAHSVWLIASLVNSVQINSPR